MLLDYLLSAELCSFFQCSLADFEELVELYVGGNPFTSDVNVQSSYTDAIHTALPQLQVLDGVRITALQ